MNDLMRASALAAWLAVCIFVAGHVFAILAAGLDRGWARLAFHVLISAGWCYWTAETWRRLRQVYRRLVTVRTEDRT